jgi:AMME syndrome candidate gene 1 protein
MTSLHPHVQNNTSYSNNNLLVFLLPTRETGRIVFVVVVLGFLMRRNNHNDGQADQSGCPPLSGSTTTTILSSLSASSTTSCSHQNSTVTVSDTEESILIATPSMCYHCFDTLIDTLQHTTTTNNNSSSFRNSSDCSSSNHNDNNSNHHHKRTNASTTIPEFVSQDLPDDGATVECPLFVTWEAKRNQSNRNRNHHVDQWHLRGCIGTLTPKLLSTAVGEYAVLSALRDKRFRPIQLSEISSLRVSISLLVQYEDCQDVYDWTVGVHGIVIKFSDPQNDNHHNHHHHQTKNNQHEQHQYNATYLPEVAEQLGWDQSQTITSLIQKAGYHGTVDADFLKTIHCTRYQSSKCQVTFDEYILHNNDNNDNNCQGRDLRSLLPPPPSSSSSRPHQYQHHDARGRLSAPATSSWTSSSCINM